MNKTDLRKSACTTPTPSSHKKKTQSLCLRQPRTFADIKVSIDPNLSRSSWRPNKGMFDPRFTKRKPKPIYFTGTIRANARDPIEYFRTVPDGMAGPDLEALLFDELFEMPVVRSVVSSCDLNAVISESCEFIEMNNSSIHPSRIFRSGLSNSCVTGSKKEAMAVSRDCGREPFDNKENENSDEKAISTLITQLRKRVQFSGLTSCKKQSMLKTIAELDAQLGFDRVNAGIRQSMTPSCSLVHGFKASDSLEALKNL